MNNDIDKEGQGHKMVEGQEQDWANVPFLRSQRLVTTLVVFLGFLSYYLQRVNLSIAIVCMVRTSHPGNTSQTTGIGILNGSQTTTSNIQNVHINQTHGDLSWINETSAYKITDISGFIPFLLPSVEDLCGSATFSGSGVDETGDFTWDKKLQGLMLSSMFFGLMVLQVPGGMLSERYGPSRVILWTMTPVAVLGFLSPLSAKISPYLFIVVRLLIGVGESALPPSMHALYARWMPLPERSLLIGISWSGNVIGCAVTFPIVSFLCSSLGWESVFYFTSAFGLAWSLLWMLLVFDSPDVNPRVSPLERRYIQAHTSYSHGGKRPAIPWRGIFTSTPFWCIVVAHTCGNYGLYMMLTQIPTYMKEVLKFDLQSNGLFSMLPFLSMFVCMAGAGWVADQLIARRILSRLWTRKLMGSFGLFLPAVCMILMTYMDCTQQFPAVVLLCGAVGLSGIIYAGFMINHGEIGPQFAGTLFGLSNVVATVPGIIAPYIVSVITPNKSREEWQIAFFICAGIHIFGGVVYLLFAQTSVQPWADLALSTSYTVDPPDTKAGIDSIGVYKMNSSKLGGVVISSNTGSGSVFGSFEVIAQSLKSRSLAGSFNDRKLNSYESLHLIGAKDVDFDGDYFRESNDSIMDSNPRQHTSDRFALT